jgi:hypothetical protein
MKAVEIFSEHSDPGKHVNNHLAHFLRQNLKRCWMSSSNAKTFKGRISDKDFGNLSARIALLGHRLYRTDPADGRMVYFIERMGLIQLADLDHAVTILTMMEAR